MTPIQGPRPETWLVLRRYELILAATAAFLLSGCADEGITEPAPTPDVDEPVEWYVVATDAAYRPQSVYRFFPDALEAEVGDTVVVTLKNAVGNLNEHTFVIDELGIRIGPVAVGEAEEYVFVADEAGSWAFYCDVGNHRQLGMQGTATVSA